jgi:hypothetical protein
VAEVGKLVLTPAHRIQSEPVESTGGFSSIRGRAATPAYEEDAEVPAATPSGNHDWFDFAAPAEREARAEEPGAPMAEMVEPAEAVAPVAEVAGRAAAPEFASEIESGVEAVTPVDPVAVLPEPEDVLAGAADAADGADWLPEDEVVSASAAEVAEEAAMPDVLEPEDRGPAQAAQQTVDEDWADAAEAEIRRELEAEAEASVFTRFDPAEELDAPGEPIFDEEMLRNLVRDIIREELQGALGERITRNVRKLVRAEIARALAVRDFE